MVDIQNIRAAVEQELGDGELFLVEARVLPGDEVEVFIDSDGRGDDGRLHGVSVEDCVRLTKAIEARFDREEEDFSLTVSSAGIGQPLRVLRQYRKLTGHTVEILTVGGAKITGVLEGVEAGADGEAGGSEAGDGLLASGAIRVSYPEKQKSEGKKKPEIVTITKTFPLSEIKTTKEYIDFK